MRSKLTLPLNSTNFDSGNDDEVTWSAMPSPMENDVLTSTLPVKIQHDARYINDRTPSGEETITADVTDSQIYPPLAGSVIAVVVLGCASLVAAILYVYLYYFRFNPGDRTAEATLRSVNAGQANRWSIPGTRYGHHVDHLLASAGSGHHGGGSSGGENHVGSRARGTHLLMFKKS